jgi:uncharacterized paraquat-inducible protein A
MRNESGINVECIFIETLDFIDINYTNLNQTIRYEQRPHGEWIEQENGLPSNHHYCSNCHEAIRIDTHNNFCPNCGADMRKRE